MSERPRATGSTRPRPPRRGRRPAGAAKAELERRRPRKERLTELSSALQWVRPASEAPTPPPRVPFRRLHILMVGWEFPPTHSGGLGVHSYELVSELSRMGHRVTFLLPFPGEYTSVPGVEILWPGSRGRRGGGPETVRFHAYDRPLSRESGFLESVESFTEWVARFRPSAAVDVVHVHDWFGTEGGSRLAHRLRRPLVLTIHSTEYDRSLGHPWADILAREALGLREADRVIAVSKHLKQQLVDRYGVAADRVRVIYNAVRPPERVARISPERPTVLYLGRLAAMKGVDTFLRAAARATPQLPNALFVVAGEGPEYPRLLALAAHLGIADRTLFLGKVTDEERTALLARADVFVLPSVVEPFGIAALEAMASGVPTILSKTSGVAEVADHAFAVDFWDIDEFASRIAELLSYPALRRTMGDLGREEAMRTGWAERAFETVGVYLEVLGVYRAGAGR
ncbi:MAG: glycosyltransferase family 4 protein [Thermoplasmata archaeon]|nr:glycosyltransferase family 4 protein [Thermoplasmata archaeon]